jgi:polysaccharide export outer membrane protein
MTTHSTKDTVRTNALRRAPTGSAPHGSVMAGAVLAASLLFVVSACQTPPAVSVTGQEAGQPRAVRPAEELTLREGDVLKIAFPAAPNLDTTQQVRRDGRISLSLVGEIQASGLTPAALEKQLIQLYSTQLVSKEVTVTVVSSSFSAFVTGAVLRPGKIQSDHRLTALEAIMEAGGFDYTKANLQEVVVIRSEGGRTHNYTLNLKLVLDGQQTEPFFLEPSDIVYVKERFSWF